MVIQASTSLASDTVPGSGASYPFLKETGGALNPAILAALTGGDLLAGDALTVLSYHEGLGIGGGEYVVAAGAGVDDLGSVIDFGSHHLQAQFGSVIDAARFGVKADGATDDTAGMKRCFEYAKSVATATNRQTVTCPPGVIMIDAVHGAGAGAFIPDEVTGGSIYVPSYTTFLGNGATLQVITNSDERYSVLRLNNPVEAHVVGPLTLIGDFDTHTGTTGEYGYGVEVLGSTDCTITNVTARKFWGDGMIIQIGWNVGLAQGQPTTGIIVRSPVCEDNRRQGLSVIQVSGGRIDNPTCNNNGGTGPASGIDIEPSNSLQVIEDLVVTNPVCNGNDGSGLIVTGGAGGGITRRVTVIGGRCDDNTVGGFVSNQPTTDCVISDLSANGNGNSGVFLTNGDKSGCVFSFGKISGSPTGLKIQDVTNLRLVGADVVDCDEGLRQQLDCADVEYQNVRVVNPTNNSFWIDEPTGGSNTRLHSCSSYIPASNTTAVRHFRAPNAGHDVRFVDMDFVGTPTGTSVDLNADASLYDYSYTLNGESFSSFDPRRSSVRYEHTSGGATTFVAGDKATFTELRADNNGAGDISLDGATSGIVLAADTGEYEVSIWADTEAPAAGDATTLEVLINGAAFSYMTVNEPSSQTASWMDLVDTTGAAQTIEVNRSSVTGTGRLDVKVKVEQLGS